jgi:hypothetical protein
MQWEFRLSLATEIPFVVDNGWTQYGCNHLIVAAAIPQLVGQGLSTPLAPVRFSLTATERNRAKLWTWP